MEDSEIVNKVKELMNIETKKSKMIITEYRLFGSLLIMTKNKYSDNMDKVKK